MQDVENLKRELKIIILKYLNENGINPRDKKTVLVHSGGIWNALVRSGRLPRGTTYDDLVSGMINASIGATFENMFSR